VVIAQKLTDVLGQQVLVENRPGAGSVIGARYVAKAVPDGYTLLLMVTGVSLSASAGYDVAKDFAPVGLIASIPIVVMANPSVPVRSLADVTVLAKEQPNTITVGTPPPPTLNYFGAEQFKTMTGTSITIVTYKGTGPLTNDLVGGSQLSRKYPRQPNPAFPGWTSYNTTVWPPQVERRRQSSSGSIRRCARS